VQLHNDVPAKASSQDIQGNTQNPVRSFPKSHKVEIHP